MILPTVNTLIRSRGHYNAWKCRLVHFRSVLKCYGSWTKWVLKFLIFGSHDTSNFENATKYLNKSWWYLFKHVCFILEEFCNTCIHTFSMEENKHLSKLSGYCQGCACVVCMTSAISWPNCVFFGRVNCIGWSNRCLENKVGRSVLFCCCLFCFQYKICELYILTESQKCQDNRFN